MPKPKIDPKVRVLTNRLLQAQGTHEVCITKVRKAELAQHKALEAVHKAEAKRWQAIAASVKKRTGHTCSADSLHEGDAEEDCLSSPTGRHIYDWSAHRPGDCVVCEAPYVHTRDTKVKRKSPTKKAKR